MPLAEEMLRITPLDLGGKEKKKERTSSFLSDAKRTFKAATCQFTE